MGRARYTPSNPQLNQMRMAAQPQGQNMMMQGNRMMHLGQAAPAARYASNFPSMMASSRSSMPGRQAPQAYNQNYSTAGGYPQNVRKSNDYYGKGDQDY